jgi:hypothetical protein
MRTLYERENIREVYMLYMRKDMTVLSRNISAGKKENINRVQGRKKEGENSQLY